MKDAFDGYLVCERYEKDGKKQVPKNLGVAFTESEAQEIIERESEWYKDNVFEYGRSKLPNGIIYAAYKENERISYTIEKCVVVSGV